MGLPSLPCTVPFSGKQWTHTEGPPRSSPGAVPGGRRRTQDGPLGFVAILPPRHLGTSSYLSVLSPEAGLGLETKQSSSGQLSSSPQAWGPPRLTPTLSVLPDHDSGRYCVHQSVRPRVSGSGCRDARTHRQPTLLLRCPIPSL